MWRLFSKLNSSPSGPERMRSLSKSSEEISSNAVRISPSTCVYWSLFAIRLISQCQALNLFDKPTLEGVYEVSRERLQRKAHSAVIRARTCGGKRDGESSSRHAQTTIAILFHQFNNSNTLAAPHRPPKQGEGGCPVPTHMVTSPYFCFIFMIPMCSKERSFSHRERRECPSWKRSRRNSPGRLD